MDEIFHSWSLQVFFKCAFSTHWSVISLQFHNVCHWQTRLGHVLTYLSIHPAVQITLLPSAKSSIVPLVYTKDGGGIFSHLLFSSRVGELKKDRGTKGWVGRNGNLPPLPLEFLAFCTPCCKCVSPFIWFSYSFYVRLQDKKLIFGRKSTNIDF